MNRQLISFFYKIKNINRNLELEYHAIQIPLLYLSEKTNLHLFHKKIQQAK
jgi:hypothetical protein